MLFYLTGTDQAMERTVAEMANFGRNMEKTISIINGLLKRKQYAQLRGLLLPMEAPDVAQIFEHLPDQDIPLVFRLLPKESAAELFVELNSDYQEQLIRSFSNAELKEVLDELYLDDAVDIVEEMPANVVKRILRRPRDAPEHQRDFEVSRGLRRLDYDDGVYRPQAGHDGARLLQAHPPQRRRRGDHQRLLRLGPGPPAQGLCHHP